MAFLKQNKIYKELKDGDPIINGCPDWEEKDIQMYFKELKISELQGYHIFHIENVSYSIFESIKILKLNVDFWEQFKYECPFTGFTHLSLIPSYICVKDINTVSNSIQSWQLNMFKDKEFMYSMFKDACRGGDLQLSKLQTIMMGAHYTDGTYPSDGSSYTYDVVLEEENGMLVICKMVMWYNK
jgi:hypothetical protein